MYWNYQKATTVIYREVAQNVKVCELLFFTGKYANSSSFLKYIFSRVND